MLSRGSSLEEVACHIQLVPGSWDTPLRSLWDGKAGARIKVFYSTEKGPSICAVANTTEKLGLDLGQQDIFRLTLSWLLRED